MLGQLLVLIPEQHDDRSFEVLDPIPASRLLCTLRQLGRLRVWMANGASTFALSTAFVDLLVGLETACIGPTTARAVARFEAPPVSMPYFDLGVRQAEPVSAPPSPRRPALRDRDTTR